MRIKMLRGGSWYYDSAYCRSAYHTWIDAGYFNNNFGFRLIIKEKKE